MAMDADAVAHITNHLLFIDDFNLLAVDSSTLGSMTSKEKKIEVIGLEINKGKSATKDTCCEETTTFLEGINVYKYLGIVEDSKGNPTRESFEEAQRKLITRVERLFHIRLNAKFYFLQ